jgi:predicted nucleic acid-binding Zn ribbon protein
MAMLYCQRCGKETDEDLVFCPECGGILAEERAELQESPVSGELEETKDRANMYVILAVVLVTVGMVGGGLLLVSSSILGLFGVALICLGVGCTAAASRYERKAGSLQKQLNR